MSARDDPHLDVDPAAAAGKPGASSPDAPGAEPLSRPPSTAEAALVARVVAWHNRHPLARRLGTAEVGGQGHLSVPCELPPARPEAGWRRWLPTRLLWRWRLRPAFDEPTLIPGLSARRIAAFAHRHAGVERSGGDPGWPERVVPMRADAQGAVPRHLMTVAIKRGAGESQRILIGPGPAQPVLGRRQWSRPRLLTAGLTTLLVLGAALGAGWWWGVRPAAATAVVASAAGPASAPASAAHAAHAGASHAKPPAAAPVSVAASAPAEAPHGVAAAGAAASAASHPPAEPASSPTAVAEAKDERPAANPHAAKVHAPADEQAPPIASIRPPRPLLKPPAPVRSHALVTAPTWHRAETEGRRTRLLRLLGGQMNGLQLEVVRLPEGEVLALWPLPTQADAEVLARRLKSSGITMLAVDF